MGLFNKNKTYTYEEVRMLINRGKADDFHFVPIETEDGYLTGEYRKVSNKEAQEIMGIERQSKTQIVQEQEKQPESSRKTFAQALRNYEHKQEPDTYVYGNYQKAKKYCSQDWSR